MLYMNLRDQSIIPGVNHLHPVLGTHTGIFRFHSSPIDDANTLRYYLQLPPNEVLLRHKSAGYNEIEHTCSSVMAFRDSAELSKRGRRLAAQFHAAQAVGKPIGWSKAQHAVNKNGHTAPSQP